MTGQTFQYCTVCGHSEYHHEKRDPATGFDRCIAQGTLDADHVYTGDTTVTLTDAFDRYHPVMRAPQTYIPIRSSEVADRMILGNDGTWTGTAGAAYEAGFDAAANGAASMDGVDQRIILANEPNLAISLAKPFSVGFWFKQDGTFTLSNELFCGKGVAADNPSFKCSRLSEGPTIRTFLRDSNGTTLRRDTADGIVADTFDDNWHYYVFTYDGSSTEAGEHCYIDGLNDDGPTTSNTPTGDLDIADAWSLGAEFGGLNSMKVALDEWAIWDCVLTADNVAALYNSGNGLLIT